MGDRFPELFHVRDFVSSLPFTVVITSNVILQGATYLQDLAVELLRPITSSIVRLDQRMLHQAVELMKDSAIIEEANSAI